MMLTLLEGLVDQVMLLLLLFHLMMLLHLLGIELVKQTTWVRYSTHSIGLALVNEQVRVRGCYIVEIHARIVAEVICE